jgi:hypothetical protein
LKIIDHLELSANFQRQAAVCAAMGAPFTARLCLVLGSNLDGHSQFGRRVLDWPLKTLPADLLALRCCAALNTLVRRGKAARLAEFYPPNANPDDAALWQAIAATIAANDAAMTAFLASPPQTNEVTRSAVLLGGFLQISAQTRMPLELYELGASAGLNLSFDRYAYNLGQGRVWGMPDSDVRLSCAWSGEAPVLDTPISILSRHAVDLRPVAAGSPDDRERMLAYIWPEQTDRILRINAALDLAAGSSWRVEAGDAVAWLKQRVPQDPSPGICRVIFHSIFLQYLPEALRDELRATIRARGEAAPKEAPLAWLSMESAPDGKTCELGLTIWPGGQRRLLANVDWHGRTAHWV